MTPAGPVTVSARKREFAMIKWFIGVLSRIILTPAFILIGYERPGVYGLPFGRRWKQLPAASGLIDGKKSENVEVILKETNFFQPEAVYMFGIDPSRPSFNLRFIVKSISVNGAPQLLAAGHSANGLLSDVFNRTDEPLLISWPQISKKNGVVIHVENLNEDPMLVFICVWGTPMTSGGLWGRLKAHFGR